MCPIIILAHCFFSFISSNFYCVRLCVVPLQLHVANCTNHAPISFELFTLSPGEGDGVEREKGEKRASQYLWSGITSYRVDSLVPQGKTELPLTACFFKPGVYNLTRYTLALIFLFFFVLITRRFKLTLQGANNANTTIHAPFQHLITITDKSAPHPSA